MLRSVLPLEAFKLKMTFNFQLANFIGEVNLHGSFADA